MATPRRFPPELADLIVDCLADDHEQLRRCLWISRQLWPRCRFHLYREVQCVVGRGMNSVENCLSLFAEYPSLQDFVREVTILGGHAQMEPYTPICGCLLQPKLAPLSNLRKLQLISMRWVACPHDTSSVTSFLRRITEFTLWHVRISSPTMELSNILGFCPELTTLRLVSTVWQNGVGEGSPSGLTAPVGSLREFQWISMDDGDVWRARRLIQRCLTSLTRLHIGAEIAVSGKACFWCSSCCLRYLQRRRSMRGDLTTLPIATGCGCIPSWSRSASSMGIGSWRKGQPW